MPKEPTVGSSTPNPGSTEAQRMGCLCPVLDNNHGETPPLPGGQWYVRMDCPLHGGPLVVPGDRSG